MAECGGPFAEQDAGLVPSGARGHRKSRTGLLSSNLPAHTHAANASSTNGDNRIPANRVYATSNNSNGPAVSIYASAGGPQVTMDPQTVAPAGGNQPHSNLQPYNVINLCIAPSGTFPSRS